MDALDVIDLLPQELAARLEADEFFADIPVVVAEKGNVAAELQRKQAVLTEKTGKRGAAVIVLQIVADDNFNNLPFGPLMLRPAFQVLENVELNGDSAGTGKSARRIARRIRDVIKSAGLAGFVGAIEADSPCIEPVDLTGELGAAVVGYQCNFRCLERQELTESQVQMPSFAAVEGLAQFTISCGTEGAAIYYTTDDSYPSELNGTAVLYGGGGVEIPAEGVTVRACGYKSGMIASWVNRATITVES